MSTVWDKLRSKVKVTVDEAGLELEKQRKIYAVRKEIAQHEATIREINAEVGRLQDQRRAALVAAGEVAYQLQKELELGTKWQEVATALEKVPEIEARIEEEEGAVAAVSQEIERFKEQIEAIRAEYRRKREAVREEGEEEGQAEGAAESAAKEPPPMDEGTETKKTKKTKKTE